MYARKLYNKITYKKAIILMAFMLVCIFMLVADISTGPADLSVWKVFFTIFDPDSSDDTTRVIVWVIRLPIALMALIVGAALGVAGVAMQTILNNPLASPYTLGVSAGAGFGAALTIVIGVSVVPHLQKFLIPANAFLFAFLTTVVICSLTKIKGASVETMILTGIAMLFLFNSLTALLQYYASEEALQAIVFWLFGSLLKADWIKFSITLVILVIVSLILLKDAWKLTALRLGDERAKGLGVDVEKLRLKTLFLISLLTAVAVCFVGTIGFIGLVAPHIARMLVGEDQRYLIPTSMFAGMLILQTASILSKVIVPGAIFPIGIVTSFIGVPFFMFLVLKRKKDVFL